MTQEFFVGPAERPDKYRLVTQEGGGGEAALWRAEVELAGEPETVAVKILRPEHAGDMARISARWAEQAELLRFVTHPSVIGVREHFEGDHPHGAGRAELAGGAPGENPGRALYLVMNWIDGQSLRDWMLLREGRVGTVAALRVLAQVADTLDMLHRGQAAPSGRAVVHGDLSPGNVMISGEGRAVLVDFGLVRLSTHRTRIAAGTPGFAAPEVWARGEYSPAADRYSFCALTYFVLLGSPPPTDPMEIAHHLFDHPFLARASSQQADLIMSGFGADPSQRPPAHEWLEQLRGGASTSARTLAPRSAAPPEVSTVYAGPQSQSANSRQPHSRRNRRLVVLASCAAAAVLLLFVLGALSITRGMTELQGGNTGTTPMPTSSANPESNSRIASATPPASPSAVIRRRSVTPLTLSSGYHADLDALSANWDVATGDDRQNDVNYQFDDYRKRGFLTGNPDNPQNSTDFAETGGGLAEYGTCAGATAYQGSIYIAAGQAFCVRTGARRYAYFRVVSVSSSNVALDVVVWDPPFGYEK